MTTVLYIVVLFLVFVLGGFVGGFLATCIDHLSKKRHNRLLDPQCIQCGHALNARDTIPVFSYIALRGRCRYCNEHISLCYPAIEVFTGALAVLSYLAFLPPVGFLVRTGFDDAGVPINATAQQLGLVASWLPFEVPMLLASGVSALMVFALLCLLIVITCVDADTMEIPNGLSALIAVLGALSFFVGPTAALAWYDHLLGAVCVSLPFLVIALIFAGSIGLGDVKLMAAAGLFLGWQLTLLAAFCGILLGGIYGIYVLATKKLGRKEHFAFGPALCAGIALSLFLGQSIITWYVGIAF